MFLIAEEAIVYSFLLVIIIRKGFVLPEKSSSFRFLLVVENEADLRKYRSANSDALSNVTTIDFRSLLAPDTFEITAEVFAAFPSVRTLRISSTILSRRNLSRPLFDQKDLRTLRRLDNDQTEFISRRRLILKPPKTILRNNSDSRLVETGRKSLDLPSFRWQLFSSSSGGPGVVGRPTENVYVSITVEPDAVACDCALLWAFDIGTELNVDESFFVHESVFEETKTPVRTHFGLPSSIKLPNYDDKDNCLAKLEMLECRRTTRTTPKMPTWFSYAADDTANISCQLNHQDILSMHDYKFSSSAHAHKNNYINIRTIEPEETRRKSVISIAANTEIRSSLTSNIRIPHLTYGDLGWIACESWTSSYPAYAISSVLIGLKPFITNDQQRPSVERINRNIPMYYIINFNYGVIGYPLDKDNLTVHKDGKQLENQQSGIQKPKFITSQIHAYRLSVHLRIPYLRLQHGSSKEIEGNYTLQICNTLGCDSRRVMLANVSGLIDNFHSSRNSHSLSRNYLNGGSRLYPSSRRYNNKNGDDGDGQQNVSGWLLIIISGSLCAFAVLSSVVIVLHYDRTRGRRRRKLRKSMRTTRRQERQRRRGRHQNQRRRGKFFFLMGNDDDNDDDDEDEYDEDGRGDPCGIPLKDSMNTYMTMMSESVSVINNSELNIIRELGEGAFGKVFLASWSRGDSSTKDLGLSMDDDHPHVIVADESNQPSTSTHHHATYQMPKTKRVAVKTLKHVSAIQEGTDLLLIFEYMDLGDLKTYLRKNGPESHLMCDPPKSRSSIHLSELLNLSIQAARGLIYLGQMKIIHRDLATRNCLLSNIRIPPQLKLSDFGMSRTVRWLPPESLNFGTFSRESDVWSFGVTLWEIFSFGKLPYPHLSNAEVVQATITQPTPLPQPKNCPDTVHMIIKNCCEQQPSQRSRITEVEASLRRIMTCSNTGRNFSLSAHDMNVTSGVHKSGSSKTFSDNRTSYSDVQTNINRSTSALRSKQTDGKESINKQPVRKESQYQLLTKITHV